MPAAIDRDRILDAALAVWREEGFRAATTRKVAARAGVGEMTLFRRFGDKASLFGAALAREAEPLAPEGIAPTDDPEADLRAIVAAYAALLDQLGSIAFDFLLETPRDPDLAAIRPVPLAAIERAAAVVGRHQRAGRLRGDDPWSAVLALLGPVLAAALLTRAQPGAVPQHNAEAVVARFLHGWSGGEP